MPDIFDQITEEKEPKKKDVFDTITETSPAPKTTGFFPKLRAALDPDKIVKATKLPKVLPFDLQEKLAPEKVEKAAKPLREWAGPTVGTAVGSILGAPTVGFAAGDVAQKLIEEKLLHETPKKSLAQKGLEAAGVPEQKGILGDVERYGLTGLEDYGLAKGGEKVLKYGWPLVKPIVDPVIKPIENLAQKAIGNLVTRFPQYGLEKILGEGTTPSMSLDEYTNWVARNARKTPPNLPPGISPVQSAVNQMRGIEIADVPTSNWTKGKDIVKNLWYQSRLSRPGLQILKGTTDLINMASEPLRKEMAGGIAAVGGPGKGAAFMGEGAADAFAKLKSIPDMASTFLKSLTAKPQSEFEQSIGREGPAFMQKIKPLMPQQWFEATMDAARVGIKNGEIASLAYRQAKKEGLKGVEFVSRVDSLIKTPTPDMLKRATEKGVYQTFQKEFTNPAMKGFESIRARGGWMVAPFFRTPTNLMKQALEHTPMNFGRILLKSEGWKFPGMKTEQWAGEKVGYELTKPIIGSLLGSAVAIEAKKGNVTGGSPSNKKDREELYAAGWQPYSIKIGDRYFSYRHVPLFNVMFGLTADMFQEGHIDDNKMKAIGYSLSNNITNFFFIDNFAKIYNAAFVTHDTKALEQILVRFFNPVPAGVGAVAKATDPYQRKVAAKTLPGELKKDIQSEIPGQREKLPIKTDSSGRPIKRTTTTAEELLSPFPSSKANEFQVREAQREIRDRRAERIARKKAKEEQEE